MEKQAGIYARYSPGRDRDRTHPSPQLPDILTLQATPFHAFNTPEMQKAAVSGLIQEIIVQPTAALEIQCSFSNWVSTDSATAYHHGNGFIQS